jgi:hypothetical protein
MGLLSRFSGGVIVACFPYERGVPFAGKISSKTLQISRINILPNQQ